MSSRAWWQAAAEQCAAGAQSGCQASSEAADRQPKLSEESSNQSDSHSDSDSEERNSSQMRLSSQLLFKALDDSQADKQLYVEARPRVLAYLLAKCPHRITEEMARLDEHTSEQAMLGYMAELQSEHGRLCGVALTARPRAASSRPSCALAAIVKHVEATECLPYMRDLICPGWHRIQCTERQRALAEARPAATYDRFMQGMIDAVTAAANVHVTIIGYSAVGKLPLHLFRFGAAGGSGESMRVMIVGGIHAREWQALCTVRELVALLCKESPLAGVDTRIDVTPCLNPDGVILSFEEHRAWRGNANNVDLNRNFTTGWHLNDRSQSHDRRGWNYRGPAPLSEAESQAMDRLLGEQKYHLVLDIHSQAGEIIAYTQTSASGPAREEVHQTDQYYDYLMERRTRRLAGEQVGAIDPAILRAMETQGQQNMKRLEQEAVKHESSLEQTLCRSLCFHLNLEPKWRHSTCGALQCHAIKHHGAQCFVVEIPCPPVRALFTKFDFDQAEAKELAQHVLEFIREHDGIRRQFENAQSGRQSGSQETCVH